MKHRGHKEHKNMDEPHYDYGDVNHFLFIYMPCAGKKAYLCNKNEANE